MPARTLYQQSFGCHGMAPSDHGKCIGGCQQGAYSFRIFVNFVMRNSRQGSAAG